MLLETCHGHCFSFLRLPCNHNFFFFTSKYFFFKFRSLRVYMQLSSGHMPVRRLPNHVLKIVFGNQQGRFTLVGSVYYAYCVPTLSRYWRYRVFRLFSFKYYIIIFRFFLRLGPCSRSQLFLTVLLSLTKHDYTGIIRGVKNPKTGILCGQQRIRFSVLCTSDQSLSTTGLCRLAFSESRFILV